jgi:hypothetical protein
MAHETVRPCPHSFRNVSRTSADPGTVSHPPKVAFSEAARQAPLCVFRRSHRLKIPVQQFFQCKFGKSSDSRANEHASKVVSVISAAPPAILSTLFLQLHRFRHFIGAHHIENGGSG